MKMKYQKTTLKDGFTIIEVVLVLAIAGLIFLMVFIALPALQRSQRDTQRRDDIARANTALTQYMANNRNRPPQFTDGALSNVPGNWGSCELNDETPPLPAMPKAFCGAYLLAGGDSFEDPDGSFYTFVLNEDGSYNFLGGDGPDPEAPDAKLDSPSGDSIVAILAAANPFGGESLMPTEFDHAIYVTYNAKCNGESIEKSTGNNKIAFQYKLEGGGVVCVNN